METIINVYKVIWGTLKERALLEVLGKDGRILKWVVNKWDGGVADCCHLAQHRNQ
jgi:hypothetical protein